MAAEVAFRSEPHITVVVIPETDRHTLHFRLPVHLIKLGLTLVLAAFVALSVTVTLLVRNLHEATLAVRERDHLRREAARREYYLHTMRQRMNEIEAELSRLQQLDQQVRELLARDTGIPIKLNPKPAVSSEGAGGPMDPVPPQVNTTGDQDSGFVTQMDRANQRAAALSPSRSGLDVGRVDETDVLRLLSLQDEISARIDSMSQLAVALQDYVTYMAHRPLGMPVNGRVTSGYGWRVSPFSRRVRQWHDGIDIAAPYGSPVRATGAGIVTFAGYRGGGYGNAVIIDHGYGITTLYAHNSKVKVKVGQRVRRGDIIALVGSTGHSTGPHVHYEVALWGRTVDPTPFLK